MSVEFPNLRYQEFDWMSLAQCKGTHTDLFFPDVATASSAVYKNAKEVCQGCPVQWDCLQFAVENGIQEGMWGGRSPNERRGLRDLAVPNSIDRQTLEATEAVVLKWKAVGYDDFMQRAGKELGLTRLSVSRRLIRLQATREKEERNGNQPTE
jgi:WhiB family redox-sensing transcriptional regulator